MMGRLVVLHMLACTGVARAQSAPAAQPGLAPAPAAPAPAAYSSLYTPTPDPPVDPRRGVIQMGANVTGSDNWIHGAYMLEGGVTVPKLLPSPYYVRARVALQLAGGTIQSDWSGDYSRFGAGGEIGGCTGFVCGFFDLDLAYQRATLDDNFREVGDRSGPHIYGRGGIDLGGGRFHVRAAIEVGRWKTHHDPSEWLKTGGFFLGLGVRI